ncbi:MAG TPA: TrkA C-terminal domain-containing protein [Armatimonadota bacterium]
MAGLTAYGTADLLGDRPIYEALLERDLLRGQDAPGLEETLLLEVKVAAGSRFAGKRLRDLGLPAGCLVVSVRRGLQEEVPCADTDLRPGDHLTLVVAPRAASAIPLIRKGVSTAQARPGVEPTDG